MYPACSISLIQSSISKENRVVPVRGPSLQSFQIQSPTRAARVVFPKRRATTENDQKHRTKHKPPLQHHFREKHTSKKNHLEKRDVGTFGPGTVSVTTISKYRPYSLKGLRCPSGTHQNFRPRPSGRARERARREGSKAAMVGVEEGVVMGLMDSKKFGIRKHFVIGYAVKVLLPGQSCWAQWMILPIKAFL